MVVPASQVPLGEPRAPTNPPGPTPVQGARLGGPSSSVYRGPNPVHLDRQQQPNVPFFYVQPLQPSLPYQWPMPMCYVPYGGFSGFGYGMVVPPFPPAYVDTPGYVLPHSQMHTVDYRRMMAPHSAPTMAYQARRFRFQHATPSSRVMVSCEVQTESSLHSGDDALSSQPTSESGRSSAPASVLSKQSEERPAHLEEGFMSSSNKSVVGSSETSNSGILFQAEEVRIECRGSPSGLKIMHSKEIAELARNSTGELLRCNVESAEDLVLRCFQPAPYTEDEHMEVMSHVQEPYLPPCPDILMMRSCPSNGTTLEDSDMTAMEPTSSALVVQGNPRLSLVRSNEDSMQHPLELQCLDELPPMEASVWSVESLIPYVPSPAWMAKNGLMTPQKPALPSVREVPSEVPLDSTPPTIPSSQEKQVGTMIEFDGLDSTTYSESRPNSCPPSSRLVDLPDPDYSNLTDKEIRNSEKSPEGLLMQKAEVNLAIEVQTSRSPTSAPQKLNKEQTNQRTKTSGVIRSDQNSSSARLCQNSSLKPKERFCRTCTIKLKAGMVFESPSLKGSSVKRPKVAHPHKSKVQLCNMCMHDPEKSGSMKVDPEISENVYSVTGPKKFPKTLSNIQNLSSGRHSEKCPMSQQSKLREQNCLCEHSKVSHSSLVWNGNDTRERNEENISSAERWRDAERLISQRSDKSWKGVASETESIKSGGKMTPKKQTQSAPTPEIHRKDTRY